MDMRSMIYAYGAPELQIMDVAFADLRAITDFRCSALAAPAIPRPSTPRPAQKWLFLC